MALITFADAQKHAARRRPWTFRMEFRGINASNTAGWSEKFWLATGRGTDEPVEVTYGPIGLSGTTLVKDWRWLTAKVPEKEGKGYVYVDTPFVRVRQSTIDAHAANTPVAASPPVVLSPPVTVKPVTTTLPVAVPAIPVPVPKTAIPSGLTGPFARIVFVTPGKNKKWQALDAAGKVVLELTSRGARDLVQAHPLITIAGLVCPC